MLVRQIDVTLYSNLVGGLEWVGNTMSVDVFGSSISGRDPGFVIKWGLSC